MRKWTSKNNTEYTIIETNLKESDFYEFQMTQKAIQVKIDLRIETVGDVVGYIWLPKWAVKNSELWLTKNMNQFNVWTKNGEYTLNQEQLIKAIEY